DGGGQLNNGTLTGTAYNMGTGTVGAVLAGTAGLTKTGTGTLSLSAANTYSGTTLVSQGVLKLTGSGGAQGTIGNSPIIVNAGAELQVAAGDTTGYSVTTKSLTLYGTLRNLGTPIFSETLGRPITLSAGTITANDSGTAGTKYYNLFNATAVITTAAGSGTSYITLPDAGQFSLRGGTFTINAGSELDVNAVLVSYSGTEGLTKNGAGLMVLQAANQYVGATSINAGTLQLANPLAAQNSTVNLTIDNSLTFAPTYSPFSIAGLSGTAGLSLLDTSGAAIELRVGSNNATSTYPGRLSDGGLGGKLTKIGTGTFTLSGLNNSYTGGTTVSAGTLAFPSALNIPGTGRSVTMGTGATVALGYAIDNATLNRLAENSNASTIATGANSSNNLDFSSSAGANLSGAFLGATGTYTDSGVLIPNGTYRLGGGGGTLTVSSLLSGPRGLIVGGNVTLPNIAPNTYTGGTTINAGTLSLGTGGTGGYTSSTGALGTGPVTINTGGKLQLWIQNSTSFNFNNSIVINGGELHGEDGNYHILGPVTVNSAGAIFSTHWSGKNLWMDSPITGTGAVAINQGGGASEVYFSNPNNSYAGATTIGSGETLKLNDANVIPDGAGKGNVTVTGTLDLNGNVETINGLTGAGTVTNGAGTGIYTLTVGNNDQTSSFTGVIKSTSGAVALTKIGAGTLTLSGANTYAGPTTISAGTLALTGTATIAATPLITIAPGAGLNATGLTAAPAGTLVLAANQILAGGGGAADITGGLSSGTAGVIIPGGPGTAATMSVTGNLTLGGGSLLLDLGASSDKIHLTGGTFTLTTGTTTNVPGVFPTGTYTIIDGYTALPSGTGTLAGTATVVRGGTYSTTFDSTVAGSTTMTVTNTAAPGTITWLAPTTGAWDTTTTGLWNDATSAPTTFYSLDNVTFPTPAAAAAVTLASNVYPGSVTFTNTSQTYTLSGAAIAGTTGLSVNGNGGTVTLANNNIYTGTTTIGAGATLNIGAGGTTGSLGTGPVTNTGTLAFNRTDPVMVSNAITGTGKILKQGTNTLVLSASGNTAGAVTASSGTLSLVNGSSLTASGDFTIGDTTGTGASFTISGGSLTVNGANFLTAAAASTPATTAFTYAQTGGTVTFNGSFLGIGNNGGTTTMSISGGSFTSTAAGMNLGVRGASILNITMGAVVTLPSITYTHPSGTANTSTINLESGATLVTNSISKGLAGSVSNFYFNGGTLRAASAGTTLLSGLDTAGTKEGGATIDTNGFAVTVGQALSHQGIATIDGGLTKIGTGILTLSGANTYNGPTSINNGTVLLSNASALQSSTVTWSAANALTFTTGLSPFTIGGLAGSGALTLSDTAATPLAVELRVGNNSINTTYSGALSGLGKLTKVGTGTLTLSGTNTQAGATSITAGTLWLTTPAALPNYGTAGMVSVSSGAALAANVGGSSDWTTANLDTLLASNGGNFAFGSTLAVDTTNATSTGVVWNSNMGGNLALTKLGANPLTLGGNNTYIGGTNINSNILSLGSAGALGTTGTISFGGGTLQFTAANTTDYSPRFSTAANQLYSIDTNGQTVTLASSLVSSGGTLSKVGSGTLLLSGINTYTGATTVAAGTLQLDNARAAQYTPISLFSNANLTFSAGNSPFTIGGLVGISNVALMDTASTPAPITLRIGSYDVSSTYSGVLSGANANLTKIGEGLLTLANAETYTGATRIEGGIVKLDFWRGSKRGYTRGDQRSRPRSCISCVVRQLQTKTTALSPREV
ncbi:MAG: autotransporter-associated beta strand repeat-containing protein, partial [Tepidisphaeraceae bacterium]